ncbi:MAG: cytochrome c, partial [Acidimicrobiia bacterium]
DLGVPADLLHRAAAARAATMGDSAEALVARWAGEAPAVPAAPAAETPAAEAPVVEAPAAEAEGLPEHLVRRTAAARAKREGRPLEEVLAEMGLGGGDATPAAAAPEPPSAPAATPAEPVPPPAVPASPAPPPEDEQVASPFAGFPRWLVASFVLLPLIAIAYALVAPNGPDCGSAGKLGIDPVTGVAQSCDGSAFGSSSVDFFTAGMDVYTGATCNVCHGDAGEGAVGPAFSGGAVLATFPAGSCADHIEWVRLGTDGWPDPTYGANALPVGGSGAKMPSFANQLSDEELRSVVLYERVAFGGEPLAQAETDCGLVSD